MARHTGENEQALRKILDMTRLTSVVAYDPGCRIDIKAFHCEILNDHDALKKEPDAYKDIPPIRTLDNTMVQQKYLQIKQDVQGYHPVRNGADVE